MSDDEQIPLPDGSLLPKGYVPGDVEFGIPPNPTPPPPGRTWRMPGETWTQTTVGESDSSL